MKGRSVVVTGAVGAVLAACGQAPPQPTATPITQTCDLISAQQVSAILGVEVAPGRESDSSCFFTPVSSGGIGNFDPTESPPPNVPVGEVVLTILSQSADSAAAGLANPPAFGAHQITIVGAASAYDVIGPHLESVFAQRGATTVRVDVGRGKGEDLYLERGLAQVVITRVPD